MANIESLHGSDKLREAYPKVNRNFNAIDKEVTDLRSRVNNIITTPIDGEAAAQEVVDARNSAAKSKIFDTLDARLEEIEQDNASVAQVLDAHKADYASLLSGGETFEGVLLRNWTGEIYYSKNDLGEVWIRGIVFAGQVAAPISILALSPDYWPKYSTPVSIYNHTTKTILPDCFVYQNNGNLILWNVEGLNTGDEVVINFKVQTGE